MGFWTPENGTEVKQPLSVIMPSQPSDCKCDWIAESYLLKIVLTITSDISIFATVKHRVVFLYEMSLTHGSGVLLPACTENRFTVSL